MKDFKRIIDKYLDRILSLDNVVGVGQGYKEVGGKKTDEECVVVLVESKVDSNSLDKGNLIPQSIDNRKTDVVEVGKVELLNNNNQTRVTRLRPAQPGVSVGHYKITAGTFGAVVKDKKTGEPLILSNNHVLANITNGSDGKAEKGDPILQPGSYDGGDEESDVIAHLERFIPIYNNQPPSCPLMFGLSKILKGVSNLVGSPYEVRPSTIENKVDCAVAKPNNPELITSEILGIGEVRGIKEPELKMLVRKSGRTSGLTTARIKALNATIKVQLSASETAVFTDQIITEPFSKPGDSGSLVVDKDNNAIGLLFAGSEKSTICNKINNVLDALKIRL